MDRGMEKANTICLPQFLWGHKNSFVKTQCVYTVHHCIKPNRFCNFDIKMNVEMFPKIYSAVSYPLSAVRFVGKNV